MTVAPLGQDMHLQLLRRRRDARGFSMIELMTVIVILGLLAAIAAAAYGRHVRAAHKTEVIGDLAAITLRQTSFKAMTGHYASSTDNENTPYPDKATLTAADGTVGWDVSQAGYTAIGKTGAHYRGGAQVHGFDALRFLPENGESYCGYGTVSGYGENYIPAGDADTPPAQTIATAVFPTDTPEQEAYFARDWFYSFALCDFDRDGTFWAFTGAHYTSDVNSTSLGPYRENE